MTQFDAPPPPPFVPPPPPAVPPPPPPRSRRPRKLLVAGVAALAVVLVTAAVVIGATVGSHPQHASTAVTGTSVVPSASASPSDTPDVPDTPPATPMGGVVYTDPTNQWSATFDGTPTYHSTSEPSPEGDLPYMFAEYSSFDVDEFVGVFLLHPGSTYNLPAGMKGLAGATKSTIVSSVPTTFQGHPAQHGVMSQTDVGYADCMLARAASVVYIICTVGETNPPDDYATFLASVKLTPH